MHCIALQLQLRLCCSIRGVVETVRYTSKPLRQTAYPSLPLSSGTACSALSVWFGPGKASLGEPAADWPLKNYQAP